MVLYWSNILYSGPRAQCALRDRKRGGRDDYCSCKPKRGPCRSWSTHQIKKYFLLIPILFELSDCLATAKMVRIEPVCLWILSFLSQAEYSLNLINDILQPSPSETPHVKFKIGDSVEYRVFKKTTEKTSAEHSKILFTFSFGWFVISIVSRIWTPFTIRNMDGGRESWFRRTRTGPSTYEPQRV